MQFMYLNYPKHRGQWAQWSFQVTVKALLTILTIDERKRGSIVVEVAVVVTEAVAAAVVVRFLLLFLQSIDLSYTSRHGLEGQQKHTSRLYKCLHVCPFPAGLK